MTTVTPDDPNAVNAPVTPATTPTFSPNFADMAVAPDQGYTNNLGLQGPDAAQNAQNAALSEAVGYANSQASPTGYGYGLNLGAPDSTTSAANLGTPDDAAVSQGAPNGFSVSAPTAADVASLSEAVGDTANVGDEGGDGEGSDGGGEGDGGDGGY